jgi:DNA mismatch repair protein MutS2
VSDLLQRVASADEAARFQPVADRRARDLLGWSRVTAQVAAHCHDRRAAEAVAATLPHAHIDIIDLWRALADELRPEGKRGTWPPITQVADALDLLAQTSPRRLEGPDLVQIARLAEDLDQLRDWLLQRRAAMPVWGEAASVIAPFAALAGDLRRCLDRDGHLTDGASPLLGRLRRAARSQEQQVRQSVQRAMADADRRGWTAASEITLRGDRFCLPIKAGEKRRIAGIVHDRSQTGQTIFVEPAETVQLANDLAEIRMEVGAEETRILLELNQRVDVHAADLAAAADLMTLADRVRAAMLWSEERRARRPRLEPGGRLRVCAGRHPLLEEALARAGGAARVIPLDLDLPADRRVLVISGPNAGGKSVSMKTVGVLVMLAQCGWDVPARDDTRLPLVGRLFVDLGDEQSIEDSLSSFSAHLTHLRRFLAEADGRSLLLCDEIGSGTDPQEGTALALAALEQLADRGSLVIASTHFGLLKAAVHDHPAMINAAMDYDEASLAPLFSLRLGDPGASHAFDIAARVGLPDGVLARARSVVGEDRYQLDQLLQDLARRARDLAESQRQAAEGAEAVQRRQADLDRRLAGLDKEIKQEREAVRRRGEDLLRQARRKLEQAVREIRSSGGDKVVVRKARDQVDAVAGELPEAAPPPLAPATVAVGDRVRVPHLGLVGRIVEVRGDKVAVVADGLRLSVDREAIATLDGAALEPAPAAPTETAGAWTWDQDDPGIPPELDLRGLRADEAWELVDKLIDRAVPVGLDSVTIVHGMGAGRLREQLLARLARDPRVGEVHPGGERRNNFGASVVHLRG